MQISFNQRAKELHSPAWGRRPERALDPEAQGLPGGEQRDAPGRDRADPEEGQSLRPPSRPACLVVKLPFYVQTFGEFSMHLADYPAMERMQGLESE